LVKILEDRIALVTGGGQGLGQAICQRLAQEGSHVVVADLNEQSAVDTAADITAVTGRRSLGLKVDVTDEAQVEAIVNRTVAEFGRLDIVVANAGVVIAGEVTELPVEKWRTVIEVNLTGYFLTA
jgi:sorbitol-6-phosphate 2-dehydrogenase